MIAPINIKDYLGPISTGLGSKDIMPSIPISGIPTNPQQMKEFCKEFNEQYQKAKELLEKASSSEFWQAEYDSAKENIKEGIDDAKKKVEKAIDDILNPSDSSNIFEQLINDIIEAVSELSDELLEYVQNALQTIYVLLSDCFGIGTETLRPVYELNLKGYVKESLQETKKTVDEELKIGQDAVASAAKYAKNGLSDSFGYMVDALFPFTITTIQNGSQSSEAIFSEYPKDWYISYYQTFPNGYAYFRGLAPTKEDSIDSLKKIMAFYLENNVKDEESYNNAYQMKYVLQNPDFENFKEIKSALKDLGY